MMFGVGELFIRSAAPAGDRSPAICTLGFCQKLSFGFAPCEALVFVLIESQTVLTEPIDVIECDVVRVSRFSVSAAIFNVLLVLLTESVQLSRLGRALDREIMQCADIVNDKAHCLLDLSNHRFFSFTSLNCNVSGRGGGAQSDMTPTYSDRAAL